PGLPANVHDTQLVNQPVSAAVNEPAERTTRPRSARIGVLFGPQVFPETGSAGLAEGWDWVASPSGSGFGRQRGADRQIGGPAIGKNLPSAGGLSDEDDEVFSALFAALTHGDGHQHLATAEIEGNLTQHFEAQRFHLHVAQSGFEQRDEKLADGGQAAHRRNAGA